MAALLNWVCFFYFAAHIIIAILFDSQVVLPEWLYPPALVDVRKAYCALYKDAMMMDPPEWFWSFCVCEVFMQLPFFPFATRAYWKGGATLRRLRLPLLVYGAHVATTVIPIVVYILLHDFSDSKFPGPSTLEERLKLIAIYAPFLVVPFFIVVDTLFGKQFRGASTTPSGKKRH